MVSVITKAALNLNGISIAYIMGVANAAFGMLIAFGVTLTDSQVSYITALLNAVLILAVHVGHRVGEATATGSASERSVQTFATTQPAPEAPTSTG